MKVNYEGIRACALGCSLMLKLVRDLGNGESKVKMRLKIRKI